MGFAPQTRLFVILARSARTGVIFRRGPSRQVLLIGWNLKDDTFECGQWLKARIYERRCDLSPDGSLLAYFAGTYKARLGTWTAISHPPYLTALALWPKRDGAGGGGLFESENTFLLNHRSDQAKLREGFVSPKRLQIKLFGQYPGRGEDDPLWHTRLLRDGWALQQEGKSKQNLKGEIWITFDPPTIYRKVSRVKGQSLTLDMRLQGIKKKNDSWYVVDYEVYDDARSSVLELPKTEWADWDSNGDLLYSAGGKLLRAKRLGGAQLQPGKELTDFSPLRFRPFKAPPDALQWRDRWKCIRLASSLPAGKQVQNRCMHQKWT